ncbi:MAG: dTMP kinase [Anaerolineae bacterium]
MTAFVTLEGPEGSGKSTQIRLLAAHLVQHGVPVTMTREPGGTPIGEKIRGLLHDPAHAGMRPLTEVLLFSASRAQLVAEVIAPALARGEVVLCDRYVESTLAYQGHGRGLDLATLEEITRYATGGLRSDLVIYLDLPVEVGLARKSAAHERADEEWTRMDQEEMAFHQRVRAGYLAMAAAEPDRWFIVDGSQPIAAVQKQIQDRVASLLACSREPGWTRGKER